MKELTEKDFEAAARKYCKLMSMDPDEKIRLPSPVGSIVGPRWVAHVDEVRAVWAMSQAIKEFL